MTIPTKNEMFAEFANCKNIDERIEQEALLDTYRNALGIY